jgi:uncharacterized membrane protein
VAWTRHWHRHPAVRSGEALTTGERYADLMRNGMGSWPFVFGFLAAMAIWGFVNTGLHLWGHNGKHGFDPYPYILLNLILSTLAGLQGAILLIAAKRADQISSELAMNDYEVNRKSERLIEENTSLTQAVKDLTEAIHAHILGEPNSR